MRKIRPSTARSNCIFREVFKARKCRLTLVFIGAALTALSQSPPKYTFSILMAGNSAGKAVQTDGANGEVAIEYSYNDRGRGPEVHGRYRFDSRGLPVLV